MAYVSQELLTEDAPLILDTTCSFLKLWPRFATIRMDVRAICSPDMVASCPRCRGDRSRMMKKSQG